jgi:hypothetical protein
MPRCLGCGKDLKEKTRKSVKEPGSKAKVQKVGCECFNSSCADKGKKQFFLEDGVMVIPVSD